MESFQLNVYSFILDILGLQLAKIILGGSQSSKLMNMMFSLICILNREADHMPHCIMSLKAGEKVVSKILLASFQWKDQLKKLNNTNAVLD